MRLPKRLANLADEPRRPRVGGWVGHPRPLELDRHEPRDPTGSRRHHGDEIGERQSHAVLRRVDPASDRDLESVLRVFRQESAAAIGRAGVAPGRQDDVVAVRLSRSNRGYPNGTQFGAVDENPVLRQHLRFVGEETLFAATDESVQSGRHDDVVAIEMESVAGRAQLDEGVVLRHN